METDQIPPMPMDEAQENVSAVDMTRVQDYNEDQIRTLSALVHIRERPGM